MGWLKRRGFQGLKQSMRALPILKPPRQPFHALKVWNGREKDEMVLALLPGMKCELESRSDKIPLWQPWVTKDEARTYSNKEMPSAKWRRERRQLINNKVIEGPLDFSTRGATALKPPPPSYDQSIQNKMSRPSVIQTVSAVNFTSNSAGKISHSDDACDPAIDEHFRRSLGKDYSSIFSKDKTESNKADNQDSDSTGLSVDDHFAKALGDTWIKLKEKENEEKINSAIKNNNNHLGNVKDLSNGQTDVSMKKKKKTSKDSMLSDKRRVVITST